MDNYDVIICGGGFAGQTLARQLKLHYADISVLLLERNQFPVKEAAHKVGESTVEIAAEYLSQDLQLKDYLDANHWPKLGLRFFWKNGGHQKCFSERSELGLSDFPVINSYQLDIGRFENDLCAMNQEAGIQVIERAMVRDITITDDDCQNTVKYQVKGSDEIITAECRWVIDAMGRRMFLQRKFDLGFTNHDEVHSAIWFRVKGRVDVADLVPTSKERWHQHVPSGKRWQSTIHLMGTGYWVWLIPLASGHTSIGIVVREEIHPFATFNRKASALAWLDKHEPNIASYIREFEIVDFLGMRDYTYTSKQIFSHQGWACIGNAAVFADPFFSPGSIIISRQNSFLTKMIGLERQGMLSAEAVSMYDDIVLKMNARFTKHLYGRYRYLDNKLIFTASFLFGNIINWGINIPLKLHSIYLDEKKYARIREILAEVYQLTAKFDQLLLDWIPKVQNRFDFDYIDYYSYPRIQQVIALQARENPSLEQLEIDYQWVAEQLEDMAQVIFLMAVEDCMHEQLECFDKHPWLNVWAMSLNPECWEEDGLFMPTSKARDLTDLTGQIRSLFQPSLSVS